MPTGSRPGLRTVLAAIGPASARSVIAIALASGRALAAIGLASARALALIGLASAWALVAAAPARADAEADCESLPASAVASAAAVLAGPDAGRAPRALLVLPKDGTGRIAADFELATGVSVAASRFSPLLCSTVVRLEGPADLPTADWVPTLPDGAFVAPDSLYRTAEAEPQPGAGPPPAEPGPPGTDPYRTLQYGLDWTGAERAGPLTRGRGARVAVLDSAPDVSHPELAAVRLLPAEDDAPVAPAVHGSLVAGVIGAASGNGLGIAGVAPEAEILALPVCTPEATAEGDACPLYELLGGLDRAWEARAQVVNLSLAGPGNVVLERATGRLDALGVVVVAAAGNDGTREPRYPAAYPSVVGVGAVDRHGAPFDRGNRGASSEIVAPGVEILSTVPGGGFAFADGTSLATAHVSGVLALLVAAGADPPAARAALFASGFAAPRASEREAVLAPACDALRRLGRPCPPPAAPGATPPPSAP